MKVTMKLRLPTQYLLMTLNLTFLFYKDAMKFDVTAGQLDVAGLSECEA